MLAKPQTYMNLSGSSISQIIDFYKIEPQDMIVIYDDIDIELGQIRIRKFGGPGTHNGMRNIVNMLATENFPRIRIGTNKPKFETDLANYVLSPMSKEDEKKVKLGIHNAVKATLTILDYGIDKAMNEFNGK